MVSSVECSFRQANEFARNILHTNIMNLEASADVKNLNFLEEKWGVGGEAVDHVMDL